MSIGEPHARSAVQNHTHLLVNDAAVAAMFGISKATVWRRVADGTLPRPIRIGGATRWDRRELLAVIDAAKSARDRRET